MWTKSNKGEKIMKYLTQEQTENLNESLKPVMKWLKENTHPHYIIIIDSEKAELVEGIISIVNPNRD